jgi:hypothetical protein
LPGSNRPHSACKADALPDELNPLYKNVITCGIEPTHAPLKHILHYTFKRDQCSVYCHSPFCDGQHQTKDALVKIGAEYQNRTDDTYLEGRGFTIKLIPQKSVPCGFCPTYYLTSTFHSFGCRQRYDPLCIGKYALPLNRLSLVMNSSQIYCFTGRVADASSLEYISEKALAIKRITVANSLTFDLLHTREQYPNCG